MRLLLFALLVAPAPAENQSGWFSAAGQEGATPVERIRLLPGFKAELLYSVPRATQGSWVSLCVDPKGRLIASDQDGGLYRITPPPLGGDASATKVEALEIRTGDPKPPEGAPAPLKIGMAHGLLYAFDSLYVMVNGRAAQGSGLYRVRDTDGDDQYDEVKLLKLLKGGGEHGPHGIVPTPDGKGLYVVCGNHTDPPAGLASSRVPRVWEEDQLLPRMPDGRGHARDRMAPGGYVCRVDPDGTNWEIVSIGYRNSYDLAVHRDGEIFTYDSDMEWDFNAPWYRPTRVCHAASGSEFGWRNGSGKWPVCYPDNLPAACDIGPGSPTGVAFGYGAKFPAKYQEALYACDWSYGKLYAVHLERRGATYVGRAEEFASAQPLPLTDLAVHPDGALYVAIGGRKVQSGLYRITYAGSEPVAPVRPVPEPTGPAKLRQSLEAFHGRKDAAAVDAAWPHLGHADRFVRFAARTALEHQPPASWQERALAEKAPQAALAALLGLVRVGEKGLQPKVLEALGRLEWARLSDAHRLDLMRVTGLAFIRMGKPDPETASRVAARFELHFPTGSPALDAELSRLLIYLESPAAVEKTLALQARALTQEEQVHYAYCLRVAKAGWTEERRRTFYGWFVKAAGYRGGHSFAPFIANIKKESLALLTEEERKTLADAIDAKPPATPGPTAVLPPRPFSRKWTVADLAPEVARPLSKRSFARGREMFAAAGCFSCHRVGADGGSFGPDLTGAGGRFSARDLLEATLEPSKVISDPYQAIRIQLADGRVVAGRIINLSGENMSVNTDMRDPDMNVSVKRSDVRGIKPSEVSMMPEALLDTLSKEEILDLLAYLISAGDPSHAAFK